MDIQKPKEPESPAPGSAAIYHASLGRLDPPVSPLLCRATGPPKAHWTPGHRVSGPGDVGLVQDAPRCPVSAPEVSGRLGAV